MKAIEILNLLTTGVMPIDRCGICRFETSNLSELTAQFGVDYSWTGHMFKGNVFFVYQSFDDSFSIDDWNIRGIALGDICADVYLFHIADD